VGRGSKIPRGDVGGGRRIIAGESGVARRGGGVNWFMVGLIAFYLGGSAEAALKRNWWQSAYNAAGALITLAAMMMGRQ